jgi:dimethylglycine oxidase
VRSCAYGFTLRRNLALAYLPISLGPGAGAEVEIFGRLVPAEIADDVLYDPGGRRVAA